MITDEHLKEAEAITAEAGTAFQQARKSENELISQAIKERFGVAVGDIVTSSGKLFKVSVIESWYDRTKSPNISAHPEKKGGGFSLNNKYLGKDYEAEGKPVTA
jgi:type IV secretory pathway TrbF-like protein